MWTEEGRAKSHYARRTKLAGLELTEKGSAALALLAVWDALPPATSAVVREAAARQYRELIGAEPPTKEEGV